MKLRFEIRVNIGYEESVKKSRDRTSQEGIGVRSRLLYSLKKLACIARHCLILYHHRESLAELMEFIAGLFM